MINGHGGNIHEAAQKLGCSPSEIVDMSSNVNPFGPLPGLADFLRQNMDSIASLPQVDAKKAVHAFAESHGIDPGFVIAGNGTTQFIYSIPLALGTKKAIIFGPTYADYGDACSMHNVYHRFKIADESTGFMPNIDQIKKDIYGFDTVFICNPNNPTGVMIPGNELESLCWSHTETRFIIDESYMPFVKDGESSSMLNCGLSNVIVLHSMSKIFRIPGLRIGFMVSPARLIEKMAHYYLPWSVNSLAQAAICHIMENRRETNAFIEDSVNAIEAEKAEFLKTLAGAPGIRLFPAAASFVLAGLTHHSAGQVCEALLKDRILIRDCTNFKGLSDRYIRLSLKTSESNQVLALPL